jgi:predicted RNase H-like HicB family nuclease
MAKIEVNLPVSILKEGDKFVAYTPALDISTSGKTAKEAQRRFDELVGIFFEELIEMETLDEVLRGLGWVRKQAKWAPPVLVSQTSQLVSV